MVSAIQFVGLCVLLVSAAVDGRSTNPVHIGVVPLAPFAQGACVKYNPVNLSLRLSYLSNPLTL